MPSAHGGVQFSRTGGWLPRSSSPPAFRDFSRGRSSSTSRSMTRSPRPEHVEPETASSAANDTLNPEPGEEPTSEEATTPKRQHQNLVEAEGAFISHEHSTAGKARIITLEDGSRILRLAELDTDNGPDLKVWLAAAPVIEGRAAGSCSTTTSTSAPAPSKAIRATRTTNSRRC